MIGGWPIDYFLYGEDTDFFYRALLIGLKVEILDVEVIHEGGGTTSRCWTDLEHAIRCEAALQAFHVKYRRVSDYLITRGIYLGRLLVRNRRGFLILLRAIFESLHRGGVQGIWGPLLHESKKYTYTT
jgi:GT2 family glycosyltransferase